MKSCNVMFMCLMAASALVSWTEAANQKCYVCDSTSDSIRCGQSNFISIGMKQDDGCLCCTKYNKDNTVKRVCEKDNALNCFPVIDRAVCLSDLCNAAPTTRATFSMIGQAFLVGAALLAMFR